ncbi:MAG: response regulator, partial [Nitrospirota bacterium]|nr:response regulator [Nitrospirota bacterium]
TIRNILKILHFGSHFLFANDGEEALNLLRKEKIDLAILDYNMPKLTGLDILEIIRNDKALQDMPVVMLTAHAEHDFIARAAELEINAYILKPITVNLLKEKIPPVIEKINYPPPMIAYLKRARKMADMGKFEDALAQARTAMETNPSSTRPLREAAEYLIVTGNFEEAEKYLKKATDMNKVDVIALSRLGELYLKKNDLDNALKYYRKAMDVSPLHYKHGLHVGKILIQKKMAEKAVPVLKKVFESVKDSAAIKEEVADLCIESGAGKFAEELLKDLVEHQPSREDLAEKLNALRSKKTGAAQEKGD